MKTKFKTTAFIKKKTTTKKTFYFTFDQSDSIHLFKKEILQTPNFLMHTMLYEYGKHAVPWHILQGTIFVSFRTGKLLKFTEMSEMMGQNDNAKA